MKPKLHILLLEDDLADAELIAQELEEDGFSFSLTRVQTEAEFCRELDAGPPDLILSDRGRPEFNSLKALEITRQQEPRLPFIFISRSNNLGMIVEMYEHGATDYVFKRDIEYLHTALRDALKIPSAETRLSPVPARFEPEPPLPQTPPLPPVCRPVVGHVSFCPRCHQAQDESGRMIRLEDYCGGSMEIIVSRRLCMECD